MKKLICIVCPKGCRMQADENGQVTGFGCEKGRAYAAEELNNPRRVLTSTVKILHAAAARMPVKTDKPIDKCLIFDAAALLKDIVLTAPVEYGTVIAKNILGTDVNFIATRDMDKTL